ncbi:hypothetical protein SPBR_09030 [Sporothrix brasiliensis 5110]|uniref:Uncharacterized protein n=1 Tax=Sporothrix brasiliensis 5110 TaxID=1398154 RepID=A0A0C2ISF3_9PEZI|nr:uncharacterized protein SPBR_09030 [Sporothrix brasiliensis 5110]KIH89780.1 hypothetical protein SPBR_09030 [Sporothrix brasiliensis 5110]
MDSLRAEDVSIETADVTSPIDDTEGSESPTESRRGKNKSDETQASSIDSHDVTKTEPPAARPPHFQEPSEDEAAMYYQWLPSQPILLGRTSSLSLPWNNAMAAPRRGAWNYGREDTSMSCGPVGAHPIREHWDNDSFRDLLSDAFNEVPYSSMVPVRVGRTIMPANERPVVLWVGIESAVASSATWPMIAHCLSLVRGILDRKQLFDVECELRSSNDIKTADAAGHLPAICPRYVLPTRGDRLRDMSTQEIACERAIATTLGTSVAPKKKKWSEGTLGLFLGPTHGTGGLDDPVWALTCHHVVCPEDGDAKDDKKNDKDEKGDDNTGSDGESSDGDTGSNDSGTPLVLMPASVQLREAIKTIHRLVAKAKDDLRSRVTEARVENFDRLSTLSDKLAAFGAAKQGRIVGHVDHAPPPGVNDHPDEPRYTRDWALIALDRAKFPQGFNFANFVDVNTLTGDPIADIINRSLHRDHRFTAPDENLMRLAGIVPLRELLGAPIAPNLVKLRSGDSCRILLKRGRSTGLTVGVEHDFRVVRRYYVGNECVQALEWMVLHIGEKRSNPNDAYENVFSATGDSGAIAFDLSGYVGGMITGGTSFAERALSGMDFTYITPMAHLLADIERELGFEVKIL